MSFLPLNDTVVTPSLDEGTILPGITRDSAIQILTDMNCKVEERAISIDELIAAYKAGSRIEVFGTGTAATISYIKELRYKDFAMQFDIAQWTIAPVLKQKINDIREGNSEDKYGWLMPVQS